MILDVEEQRDWPRIEKRGKEHPKYGGDECQHVKLVSCHQFYEVPFLLCFRGALKNRYRTLGESVVLNQSVQQTL